MSDDWLPIESAPKDGSWFVTVDASDPNAPLYEVGYYSPYYHASFVEVPGGLYRKDNKLLLEWAGFDNFPRATHWIPLPPHP